MSFIDFLIQNYIYIIVVLIILIITVIGFIADKSSKAKKRRKAENNQEVANTSVGVNPGVIDNNILNSNMNPQNPNLEPLGTLNVTNQPLNQTGEMVNGFNSVNEGVNINLERNVNPRPVNNMGYQPIEDQRPTFEPRPINVTTNLNTGSEMVIPEAVMPTPTPVNKINEIPVVNPNVIGSNISQEPVVNVNMANQPINPNPVNQPMPGVMPNTIVSPIPNPINPNPMGTNNPNPVVMGNDQGGVNIGINPIPTPTSEAGPNQNPGLNPGVMNFVTGVSPDNNANQNPYGNASNNDTLDNTWKM